MELPTAHREVRLASRPTGWPTAENFALVEVPLGRPAAGQLLVRNLVMSVDPSMRGRMNDVRSYSPSFRVGEALWGGAVGEVIESTVDGFQAGETVLHGLGWREYALVDAGDAVRVDTSIAPAGAYLGVLGMPGLTAFAGLLNVGGFRAGETLFVSAAAGAVGSAVGQIARLHGAGHVIGSAGTTEKVRHLIDDLGFNAAFNYHDGPVAAQLAAAAPHGIDLYFDNVGGEHLEAALDALTVHGRVVACGMISTYNDVAGSPAPRNLRLVVGKRLRILGMLVHDHADQREDFLRQMQQWLRAGEIRYRETVVSGLANAPAALVGLLQGDNIGKMLVTL
jgi:NADPH-dependent curcumin reductase CurA